MSSYNIRLPDLIELSSINANATFTTTPGGGGDIIGVVDNARYTDREDNNHGSDIREINRTNSYEQGQLSIDGVTYNIQIHVPSSLSQAVTVTYDGGSSSIDLHGYYYKSDVAFIQASPMGGGSDRYFAVFDDDIGDLPNITAIKIPNIKWNVHDVIMDVDQDNVMAPVCFGTGTEIETPSGKRRVETLLPGDLVHTVDHGPQPILCTLIREMTFHFGPHSHKPILIQTGAFGESRPCRNLIVSPQHRICVQDHKGREVLIPAKSLLSLPKVRQMNGIRKQRYFAFLLAKHSLLLAENTLPRASFPDQQRCRCCPRSKKTRCFIISRD